jgi:para-nitrobenzyl esterase
MDAALAVYDQHFFDPVIDGVTLSQSPYEALSMQDIDPPNVLIGSNGDEWLMYLENEDTPDSWVERSIPSSGMRAAIKREIETIQNPEHALDRLITATNYVCPSMALASRVVASGGSVWFYLFDRTRPGTVSASMGAYHGAELPYVFNTHDDWLPTDSSDLRLSEQMGAAWVNFARSGSPGTVGNILWPAYDNERKQVLVFDDTLRVEEHRDRALCALIRG